MGKKSSKKEVVLKNDAGNTIIPGANEGKEVLYSKDFGCGLDVHSRFIQVSALVRNDLSIYEYRNQFATDVLETRH